MNLSNSYKTHVAITKELKMHSDFTNAREPYKDDFEKLYNKAKEEKVNISNAKDFLNSLSKEELSTLQHYSGLADKIQTGKLNDEGAYNLLLHHYEKYDFDKDGYVMNGLARGVTLIPTNMPDAEKRAYVKTLNEMDENDAFEVMMMVNLPKSFKLENGEFVPVMSDEPYDYTTLLKEIDRLFNPLPGEHISQRVVDAFKKFLPIFERNFAEENKLNSILANNENNTNLVKAKLENSRK